MRFILCFVAILGCSTPAFSQKETSNWFFSTNWLKIEKSGVTNISNAAASNIYSYSGSNSVSDANGNLLFISDGVRIYNKNLQVMSGVSDEFYSAGSALLSAPFPGSPSKHYLFYVNQVNSTFHLKYAVIDMNANSGMGTVLSVGNIVDTGLSRGFTLTVVPHSDEFWIVSHRYMTDTFISRKVTSLGVGAAVKTRAGSNGKIQDYRFEELKTSPDGKLIAGYVYADYTYIFAEVYTFVEVFYFDPSNGRISSKVKTRRNFGYFGFGSIEFSADSRLLYLIGSNSSSGLQPCDFGSSAVTQFNLCYNDSVEFTDYAMITGGTFSWCSVQNWGRAELGADRKIHMAYRPSLNFSSIHFPNRLGSSSFTEFAAHSLLRQAYSNDIPSFNHRYIAKAVINNIRYNGGCYPSATAFEITNDTIGSVQWNFGDPASGANTSNLLKPSHTFSAPGVYIVTAQLYTTAGKFIETLEEKVEIKDPDKRLLLDFPKDTSFCAGGKFKIKLAVVNGIFKWTMKEPNGGWLYNEGVSDSITIERSGIYYVEMRQNDCDGCRMYDSIKVVVNPRPYTFLGYPRSVCGNDSIKLEVYDEGAEYIWSNGHTGTNIWVKQPGIYWVQGEFNNSGCPRRDSIVISAAPAISYSLPADTSICENTSLQLESPLNNAFHVWNGNNYGNRFVVDRPGDVTLKIIDNNGCELYDTMNVSLNSSPWIFAGNDTTLCAGTDMQLTVSSSASNFIWNTGSTSATINVHTSGTYIVETTDGPCFSKDTVKVRFSHMPDAQLGADKSICSGEEVLLSTADTNGSFLWSDGSSATSLLAAQPGLYWVRRNIDGCVDADTINLLLKPTPVVNLGEDTTLCDGTTLILDAAVDNAGYVWQDQSGSRTYTVRREGRYSVEVDLDGCKATDFVEVQFRKAPAVNLGNDLEICPDQKIILDPLISDAELLWQDGSSTTTFTVTAPGNYKLAATNRCGSTSDEIVITQGMCNLAIPNAFTPNNDGKNDVLVISNPSQVSKYQMQVFNRWGQLVFSSTDPYKGWDGRFNAAAQPEGSYLWTITLTDKEGNRVTRKGSVLLIR